MCRKLIAELNSIILNRTPGYGRAFLRIDWMGIIRILSEWSPAIWCIY